MAEEQVISKILVFMGEPRYFEASAVFLGQNGIKVQYARMMTEAIGQINKFKPDVVLLSWNLKRVNVKEMTSFFSEKLQTPVIVFSELNDPTITLKLNASGIKNTMYPPISGPRVLSRLKLFQKAMNSDAPIAKEDIGADLADGAKIPESTAWERVSGDPRLTEGVSIWKGKSPDAKEDFFYEGSRAPTFNASEKKWETDSKGTFYLKTDEKTGADLDDIVIRNEEKGPIVTAQSSQAIASGGHQALSTDTPSSKGKAENISILEVALTKAIGNCILKKKADDWVEDSDYDIHFGVVKSQRFCGYLLGVHPQAQGLPEFCEQVFVSLSEQLRSTDGECTVEFNHQVVQMSGAQVLLWISRAAVFEVSAELKNKNICFFYSAIESFPELVEHDDTKFFGFSAKKNLIVDTTITFDMYLYLPRNNKHLLYLRKGSVMTQELLNKIDRFSIEYFYFRRDQKDEFYTYSGKNIIAAKAG